MLLDRLLNRIHPIAVLGASPVDIGGIGHDSRSVAAGDMFVCLVGEKFDGHAFVPDAVRAGAAAIVVQEGASWPAAMRQPVVVVSDTRAALAELSCAIYGDPSAHLALIGVTGTNGKTTTVHLISGVLAAAGMPTGTIGTLGAMIGGVALPSEHTTPEADQTQSLLAEMLKRGARAVAMEVSSHALAKRRTDGCRFAAAAMTNLSQDHLDYHLTMDAYREAKMRLFEEYPLRSEKPFVGSVNLDDPSGPEFAARCRGRVLTYGMRPDADIRASDVRVDPGGASFGLTTPLGSARVELRIGGVFQVYNAMAAVGVAVGLGVPLDAIVSGLASVRSVPGRFESVPTGREFHAIVDYAHTPDGLANLISSARRLNPRRVIVVFGCGGDRDRTKRPVMGRIAGEAADVAIVTSDNPRTEDPDAIIREVVAGMEGARAHVTVEPDRRAAIGLAIEMARNGDIVLIAGKGHEDYQIVGDENRPFDDRIVVRELLGLT